MDRTSFINKYSAFDTLDIAERIAEKITKYIENDGIEYLDGREIHGRHTGYLDISSGGFRNEYDFLCPVLDLCRVDRNGIVSADIRKIEKYLDNWRGSLNTITDEEVEYIGDADFIEDDSLYAFRNVTYDAELDSFLELDSPSVEEILAHEEAIEEIWDLSSVDNLYATDDGEDSACPDQPNGQEDNPRSPFQREYDAYGFPIYTDEEVEIYEQAVDDMDKKFDSFLNRCREIFYREGKETLNGYLNDLEEYSSRQEDDNSYDDPKYFPDYEIKRIRERFNVWDEEKERLEREEMLKRIEECVDEYWNDPYREQRSDWISPTLVQDLKNDWENSYNKPSFAEFVSKIRRGKFGDLPEDYDGLASSDDPGYYGE